MPSSWPDESPPPNTYREPPRPAPAASCSAVGSAPITRPPADDERDHLRARRVGRVQTARQPHLVTERGRGRILQRRGQRRARRLRVLDEPRNRDRRNGRPRRDGRRRHPVRDGVAVARRESRVHDHCHHGDEHDEREPGAAIRRLRRTEGDGTGRRRSGAVKSGAIPWRCRAAGCAHAPKLPWRRCRRSGTAGRSHRWPRAQSTPRHRPGPVQGWHAYR